MKRHIFYTVALALALTGAGAWAVETQGNGAGTGTELQNPAPANPNPPAQPDQAAPNAAQPSQDQNSQNNPNQNNPAPPNQNQNNPAQPNQAPPNADQQNPNNQAQPNPAAPAPDQQNLTPPNAGQQNQNQSQSGMSGQQGATPTYYSPLQEFMSHQLDEIGVLSQEITQFRAAKRPEAVMALYHMIRDHRLAADAAANILARRGDVTTPTFTVMPIPNTPEEAIHQNLQEHQQAQSNLQQMISNASSPEEKRLYQRALDATNQHMAWLQSLDQNQNVAVGFFGPTTPLGDLSGTATVASAAGYPQPVISRTAGFQQQFAGNGSGRRTPMRRGIRHRRYRSRRYSRYHGYTRSSNYR